MHYLYELQKKQQKGAHAATPRPLETMAEGSGGCDDVAEKRLHPGGGLLLQVRRALPPTRQGRCIHQSWSVVYIRKARHPGGTGL